MTIYRNGVAIELTYMEKYQTWLEWHTTCLREDIRSIIDDEEETGLSFSSFAEHGYSSEKEFRSAFVEECFPEVDKMVNNGVFSLDAARETVQDLAGKWNYNLYTEVK